MNKSQFEFIIALWLCLLGATTMLQFNYYTDFILPQKMSLEDLIFYNSQYHFSFERSICFIFFAFSGALLLNNLGFWDIRNYINKKIIKEKIKEGKRELQFF